MGSPSVSARQGAPCVLRLLATDRREVRGGRIAGMTVDTARRGAVAIRARGGAVRRAEPGPRGPLILEARPDDDAVVVEVWGPAATPVGAVEQAMTSAASWAGLDDDVDGFGDLVASHPTLRTLHRRLGAPRLSRLPRIGEAVGRAVIAQLVQTVEARRSTSQVAALIGEPAGGGLWAWPTADRLARTPAWALRGCGLSSRRVLALHAASTAEGTLSRTRGDWRQLDLRLRTLPGVGAWTSAEARLALGDPDAVSVGDYHLPHLVGAVLAGDAGDGPDGRWTDTGMLAVLAPYPGHRGRVIRLVLDGLAAGLVRRPARRAPRAPLARHRYW